MYFQITGIVLWPKDTRFPPRLLSFATGDVNVISGASRTGKSAIIPIIDYCLGAEKCTIPVKTIRDACAWFGILVQTDEGTKLFARREPGRQKTTGDMYLVEGSQLNIPERIEEKNTTSEAVKHLLDELAGLTTLDFDPSEGNVGFQSRPSFRDLGAFLYQPQNVVANPDVLFYKADTSEHREKLRTIFPYVLGAVTPEILAKQHELAELQRELRRKQNELSAIRQVSERWLSEIRARVSEARELGLLRRQVAPTAGRDELVDLLREVVDTYSGDIQVTPENMSEAVQELGELQREEVSVAQELSGLRTRLAEMNALRNASGEFRMSLLVRRDRLKLAEWLGMTHERDRPCPICGKAMDGPTHELDALCQALHEVEAAAGVLDRLPAAFDREFERVRALVRTVAEKLDGVKLRRNALGRRSEEARQRQYDSMGVSRFVGNLEQSLETYSEVGENGALTDEVRGMEARVAELQGEISAARVATKLQSALEAVNMKAGRLLPHLDLERPDDPVVLWIQDLTIKVRGQDRDDYLWEIGSGSNWLSYHLAISMALQQFFLSLRHTPVPSLLVFDQPSQVYFPKRLAAREDEGDEEESRLKDEDVEAVRKAFVVMSSVVREAAGRLQIIVLDHAAENTWGHIENVNLVEEWRGGKKLVPEEWYR